MMKLLFYAEASNIFKIWNINLTIKVNQILQYLLMPDCARDTFIVFISNFGVTRVMHNVTLNSSMNSSLKGE